MVDALTVIYKYFTSDTDEPSVATSLFFLTETGLIKARTEFLCQVIGWTALTCQFFLPSLGRTPPIHHVLAVRRDEEVFFRTRHYHSLFSSRALPSVS